MQEILQEVAEEEVSLRCYPTYLDDNIEEEESPEDDFSKPKSEEMTKHFWKILWTMKIFDNECFSIQGLPLGICI